MALAVNAEAAAMAAILAHLGRAVGGLPARIAHALLIHASPMTRAT